MSIPKWTNSLKSASQKTFSNFKKNVNYFCWRWRPTGLFSEVQSGPEHPSCRSWYHKGRGLSVCSRVLASLIEACLAPSVISWRMLGSYPGIGLGLCRNLFQDLMLESLFCLYGMSVCKFSQKWLVLGVKLFVILLFISFLGICVRMRVWICLNVRVCVKYCHKDNSINYFLKRRGIYSHQTIENKHQKQLGMLFMNPADSCLSIHLTLHWLLLTQNFCRFWYLTACVSHPRARRHGCAPWW